MANNIVSPRTSRRDDELRVVTLERNVVPYAEGSCLISFGATRVLCTASVEDGVPGWRRGRGDGWLTAEYAMLPRATRTLPIHDFFERVSVHAHSGPSACGWK